MNRRWHIGVQCAAIFAQIALPKLEFALGHDWTEAVHAIITSVQAMAAIWAHGLDTDGRPLNPPVGGGK